MVKELGLANEKPPPLKTIALLPQGTKWTPVDDALERLKSVSKCLVETEQLSAKDTTGRVLATNIHAGLAVLLMQILNVDGYAVNSKI